MKFAPISLVLAIASVDGFSIPSSLSPPHPTTLLHAAISPLDDSFDPYAPLLDKLNQHLPSTAAFASTSTTTTTISSTPTEAAITDTPPTLLDVLSSTLDAANEAAAASAEVSKLAFQYRPASAVVTNANVDVIHNEAISTLLTDARTKLSALEEQLHTLRTTTPVAASSSSTTNNGVDLPQLTTALHQAMDTSLYAAELASHSTTELVHAMVRFNVQLGQDMSHVVTTTGVPLESVEWIRSHLAERMGGMLPSLTVGDSSMAWQQFVNVMDRTLDDFGSWEGGDAFSSEGAAVLVVYGIVAYLVGYSSQSSMGVEGYKSRIRGWMENGTFDVDQLAKEVGYVPVNLAAATSSLTSVDYDAAAMLAYQSSRETVSFESFKARYLRETSAMIAKKNPYVKTVNAQNPSLASAALKQDTLTSVDYDAAARLAYQTSNPSIDFNTFKSQYLAQTSAMVAQKHKARHNADGLLPAPPTQEISAESFMKQPMVNVMTESKPTKTIVKSTPKLPLASPLARLLAEELGLELTSIGKGSGKNGKILIEDVRMFQERMERTRRSIAARSAPYFATANA